MNFNVDNTQINNYLNNYLQYRGVTKAILDFFEVKVENEDSNLLTIHYPYLDGSVKTCKPHSEKKWIRTIPTRDENVPCIFGYNQLPKKGDLVIIAAGEKDTMALYSLGISAICFNSETASVDQVVVEDLAKRFKDVVLLYDIDKTGVKQSLEAATKLGIPFAKLPHGEYGKDVTDYLTSGGTKVEIEKIVRKGISSFYRELTHFQAGLLDKMFFTEEDYIIPGILACDSLCSLVGGSDSGKSLFALQFSIAYILNKKFLDQTINGGKKVLYLALEDSKQAVERRMRLLYSDLSDSEIAVIKSNLFFCFLNQFPIESIEDHLAQYPETGFIVIDTFSELAIGKDINSSGDVRQILRPLHLLCQRFETSVLIIHHIEVSV
jgi:hypothetical protein